MEAVDGAGNARASGYGSPRCCDVGGSVALVAGYGEGWVAGEAGEGVGVGAGLAAASRKDQSGIAGGAGGGGGSGAGEAGGVAGDDFSADDAEAGTGCETLECSIDSDGALGAARGAFIEVAVSALVYFFAFSCGFAVAVIVEVVVIIAAGAGGVVRAGHAVARTVLADACAHEVGVGAGQAPGDVAFVAAGVFAGRAAGAVVIGTDWTADGLGDWVEHVGSSTRERACAGAGESEAADAFGAGGSAGGGAGEAVGHRGCTADCGAAFVFGVDDVGVLAGGAYGGAGAGPAVGDETAAELALACSVDEVAGGTLGADSGGIAGDAGHAVGDL